MQVQGKTVKLKVDYSENETKLKGVVDCKCGRKVIIDEIINDSIVNFDVEKVDALSVNEKIVNPDLPDSLVLQSKLNKAIELVDYLLVNGMFNAAVVDKVKADKEKIV